MRTGLPAGAAGAADVLMPPASVERAGRARFRPAAEPAGVLWDRPAFRLRTRIAKRTVDLVGAISLLLVLSPVLIVTAAAVKMTSRGPVLFRQRRLGRNGVEFRILKFRSMFDGAEQRRGDLLQLNDQDGGGVLFKIHEDPRITPVGRWIRKLSIDELPQLLHVVTGTMSLVGPRPLASVDSVYTGAARRRLLVRPGLTGIWQVSGRSHLTWEQALQLDLEYVDTWSLGLDLRILIRTVAAVVTRTGAY